jgi:hypothetical protein
MKLTKYVITKFKPKDIEEERIPCSKLNGGKEEILYKPREPSEFEGKTIAIETSGVLFDKKELIELITLAKETADLAYKNSKSSPELAAHRGASYAFKILIKELQ